MSDWDWHSIVFLVCVGSFSLAAGYSDFRSHRIPNLLTVPMFALGWVFQGCFAGWSGVLDAGAAFAVGFGTLLLLWLMGSGGGGDVKLMGALSVWLGLRMTILVMVFSTVLVLLGTLLLVCTNVGRKWEFHEPPATGDGDSLRKRRIMAFAVPVAVVTWVLMVLKLPLV